MSFKLSRKLCRRYSGAAGKMSSPLVQRVAALMPEQQEYFKRWKAENADKVLMEKITVRQAFDMKGIKGIRYRNIPLKEVLKKLPKTSNRPETAKAQKAVLSPLPEGALWLFLTGQIPSEEETRLVAEDLASRARLPEDTVRLIDSYPKAMHPMVQLSSAVLSMSTESKFHRAYFERVPKDTFWLYTLDDGLDLIARAPGIAARIYRNVFGKKEIPVTPNTPKDLAALFARQLGFESFEFDELMRLYLTIHADHESGNVSSHAAHLVNSALSDPFVAFSAAANGLYGPLHGLANQEVLEWIKKVDQALPGAQLTLESLSDHVRSTLTAGGVIPGFGHAVLRVIDPRYLSQQKFAEAYLDPKDRLYTIVRLLNKVVPGILSETGKVKNPYPNVDGHSGVLLNYFGLTESNFYTVLFAVSRTIGIMSSLTLSRAYGLPIERPKSITTKWVTDNIK